jgi:flagellar FliJ protein
MSAATSLLKTLALAIEVAERKRDQTSQALALAQQRRMAAQQQLDQLQSYAHETEQRWASQAQVHAVPELMQHHYQFMTRLDQASVMQQHTVAEQDRWVVQVQQMLLAAELRVATLRQATRHKQDAIDLAQRRREQRQMDEMAATRHAMVARQAAQEVNHGD